MADPAPAAAPSPAPSRPSPPSPASPAPAPAARPGSLTGVRYDAPISDQAFDRLGPQDQSRYARVRDQNNNPTWQPRSDLAPSPAPKPAVAQPGEPPAPAAPPASVVDGKLRVGEFDLSSDDIAALMATKAQADLRATQVPADPSGYKPDLPADLKLPPGIEFKIDVNDPAYKDLANFAHARGWDQEAFSTAIGIFASREAREAAAFNAAVAAERAKLGAVATDRATAIQTWLRSVIQNDDLTGAVMKGLWSAKQVQALEIIASKMTTQGAASFSQAHPNHRPVPVV